MPCAAQRSVRNAKPYAKEGCPEAAAAAAAAAGGMEAFELILTAELVGFLKLFFINLFFSFLSICVGPTVGADQNVPKPENSCETTDSSPLSVTVCPL